MAYYKICYICGCNLDPGEICDCKEKSRENEARFEKLTKVTEETQSGQIELNLEFASRVRSIKVEEDENMTKKQIIERLTKIENFLLLSNDEIIEKNNTNIKGYINSYKVGWVKSAVQSLIAEIEAKS